MDIQRQENVLWSDESPFQLFDSKYNTICAKSKEDVPPVFSVKFPTKVHVWGMMFHQDLSELYIIPNGQSINAAD